jgi:hypothetical protein
MIAYDKRVLGFKTRRIWLSSRPFDVEGIDSVCFHACRTKMDLPGFHREDRATIVIDVTRDMDHIWGMMSPKCRSGIRRAERDGGMVHMDRGHKEFLKLNEEFRTQKGLDYNTFPLSFAQERGKLFTAEMNGQMVGGILFIDDGETLLGLISASRRLNVEGEMVSSISNVNRLLWWRAIEYARENGLSMVDMGGYYIGSEPDPQSEGINEFKRRFGGEIVNSYEYRKDYTFKIKIAHALQRRTRLQLVH